MKQIFTDEEHRSLEWNFGSLYGIRFKESAMFQIVPIYSYWPPHRISLFICSHAHHTHGPMGFARTAGNADISDLIYSSDITYRRFYGEKEFQCIKARKPDYYMTLNQARVSFGSRIPMLDCETFSHT